MLGIAIAAHRPGDKESAKVNSMVGLRANTLERNKTNRQLTKARVSAWVGRQSEEGFGREPRVTVNRITRKDARYKEDEKCKIHERGLRKQVKTSKCFGTKVKRRTKTRTKTKRRGIERKTKRHCMKGSEIRRKISKSQIQTWNVDLAFRLRHLLHMNRIIHSM